MTNFVWDFTYDLNIKSHLKHRKQDGTEVISQREGEFELFIKYILYLYASLQMLNLIFRERILQMIPLRRN